jgi:hypothetical protein
MEENAIRPAGRRWLWLALPLAISSFGWAFAPFQLTSSGWGSMGADLTAGFAGILATALTGSATIVVLRAIGTMPRMSLQQYVGIVFAVALPALSFESLDVPASAMPAILGKWVTAGSAPFVELWLGLAFVAIYAVMTVATYPFVRRGGIGATVAAIAPAVLVFSWIAYGLTRL